jgi:hypothetical protein
VECVRSLARSRLVIDVNRVRPNLQRHYLSFWAHVDMRSPDECWPLNGMPGLTDRSCFLFTPYRNKMDRVTPVRGAVWFSWGDLGQLPYRKLCKTMNCCNPLHLRLQQVPHYIYRREIDLINLTASVEQTRAQQRECVQTILDDDITRIRKLRPFDRTWIERVARNSLQALVDQENDSS